MTPWSRACFVCGGKGTTHKASGLSLCEVCGRCAPPDAMADVNAGRNIQRARGDIALARARAAEHQRDWWRAKLKAELRTAAETWRRYLKTARGPRPESADAVEEVLAWLAGLDDDPAGLVAGPEIDAEDL